MSSLPTPATGFTSNITDWLARYRLHISLFLFVFGFRMWAHAYAGGPIPFYDQWVFGFNNLAIVPATQNFAFLRFSHNEHRLITTECIDLIGLWWNGYYDVRVSLVVAALVRALNATLGFQLLRGTSQKSQLWAWIGCLFVCAVPYSGYNALNGMMVCMYFSDLNLLFAVWLLREWPTCRSWKYPALLIGSSVLGLLSFSQAILIPGATLCIHLVSRRTRPGFLPAWCATAVLAVVLFVLSPQGPPWAYPSINNILRILGWPMPYPTLCAALVIMYVISIAKFYDAKSQSTPTVQALLGIAIYSGGAAALLALKRSDDFNIRHFESIAPIGFVVLAIAANANSKSIRICSYVFLIVLCIAWVRPIQQTWSYYQANNAHKEEAVELIKNIIVQGKMEEFGNIISRKIIKHDYSFFLDPILQYSPGEAVGNTISKYPYSLLKMPPELLPIRKPTNLSLLLYALVQLYGIFIVIAVALLYPWRREGKNGAEPQLRERTGQ